MCCVYKYRFDQTTVRDACHIIEPKLAKNQSIIIDMECRFYTIADSLSRPICHECCIA